MANAILSGRKHRASGELAYHVLDIMIAIQESSDRSAAVNIQSTVQQPAPIGQKDIDIFGWID
jgi:hypothetical protein